MSDASLTSAGEAEGISREVKAIGVMAALALAAFVLGAVGFALASPEALDLIVAGLSA